MSVNQLIAQQVVELEPYESPDFDQGSTAVRLNANEYPQDCPMTVALSDMNRYPQAQSTLLKKAYADYAGLTPEQVLVCRGGDEAIEVLVRAFCTPGCDKILICPPTYAMYAISAQTANVGIARVPMIECAFDEAQIDAALSADASIKVLFLCNPNNPLTSTVTPQALESVVKTVAGRAIVVIDEAYSDFSSEKPFRLELAHYPNMIVLNTMSKAWGCAGIRLGMAFASKEIVKLFNKVKYPYNISNLTQNQACELLKDPFQVDKWIKTILLERTRVIDAINILPICKKTYPTNANFVLVEMENAQNIYDYLVKKGVIVRNRNRVTMCSNCLRISIGTKSENNELLAALRQYQIS